MSWRLGGSVFEFANSIFVGRVETCLLNLTICSQSLGIVIWHHSSIFVIILFGGGDIFDAVGMSNAEWEILP